MKILIVSSGMHSDYHIVGIYEFKGETQEDLETEFKKACDYNYCDHKIYAKIKARFKTDYHAFEADDIVKLWLEQEKGYKELEQEEYRLLSL